MSAASGRLWVAMPAAGSGRRFGDGQPKQYADLLGRPMIHWALEPLLARDDIAGAMVAVNAADDAWRKYRPASDKLHDTCGGESRSDSVQAALLALTGVAGPTDWVLVHDAARPCLDPADLERLVSEVRSGGAGGLLAAPVADTIKRAVDGRVVATLDRDALWRALTPQMFPLGALLDALVRAHEAGASVTDEAAAMELAGHQPRLVAGRADNIKVTQPEDLLLAAAILQARRATG